MQTKECKSCECFKKTGNSNCTECSVDGLCTKQKLYKFEWDKCNIKV